MQAILYDDRDREWIAENNRADEIARAEDEARAVTLEFKTPGRHVGACRGPLFDEVEPQLFDEGER